MRLRSFRTFTLPMFLFFVLLVLDVAETTAQNLKQRVGRHSPAYMRSVLYLFHNIGKHSEQGLSVSPRDNLVVSWGQLNQNANN
jgi:hypothetical protein